MQASTKFAALLVATYIAQPASAVEYEHLCAATPPPKDAEITHSHGMSFYAFPRDIGKLYTGCRYMWLEDKTLLYRIYFIEGKLRWSRGNSPEEDESICFYENGKLLRNQSINPEGCPKP
jgi:hypothetical protein